MIKKEKSWTIVIVGHWNRMIFSPDWVVKEIFGVKQLETLVPITPGAPILYRNDDICLSVSEQRLIFEIRKFSDECIRAAEEKVCIVLRELSRTPVTAIGVNFGFKEDNPGKKLLALFNLADESKIAPEWEIKTTKLTREIVRSDIKLNLTISKNNGCIELDANFHRDVKSAIEAEKAIKDKTIKMKKIVLKLLDQTYDLIEKEEKNGN
jgi:hypothetical protein